MTDFSPEQVNLFRSLFSGREDAYGLEAKNGPISIKEPLTDKEIQSHLEGKKRIGVYLLSLDSTITWAAFDFDSITPEKLQLVIAKSIESQFYPYPESSKNRGYHVHFFFDEPIKAKPVRALMNRILKEVEISGEVFPKQDTSGNGSFGNFLWGPLQGESAKKNRTLFLNSELTPYPDQWEHLTRIHRTKTENILELVKEFHLDESQKPELQPDSDSGLDLEKYLRHYRIDFKIKRDGRRTFYLLNQCLFADSHTTKDNLGDSSIVQDDSGKLTYQCFHGHCKGRTWADAREKISGADSLIQFCRGEVVTRSGRNLTEEIRAWVEGAFSRFTTEQLCKDLGITSTKEKGHARVELHRMVEKGILERGSINGTFIKIESQTRVLEIKAERPTPLKVSLPGGLQKRVSIYKHNLLVVAGSSNGGKTAYALNAAYDNRNLFDVHYLTTEMDSDELTLRVHNFGYTLKEWAKVTFRPWESMHSIKPDGFNVVDYLEVREGEFWRVGDDLRKIFEKLNSGIALVCLQMDKGSKFGWGGQKTVDKARLYFTLDDNKLTIVKGKNWAGLTNPNGEVIPFKIIQGARFDWGQSG